MVIVHSNLNPLCKLSWANSFAYRGISEVPCNICLYLCSFFSTQVTLVFVALHFPFVSSPWTSDFLAIHFITHPGLSSLPFIFYWPTSAAYWLSRPHPTVTSLWDLLFQMVYIKDSLSSPTQIKIFLLAASQGRGIKQGDASAKRLVLHPLKYFCSHLWKPRRHSIFLW